VSEPEPDPLLAATRRKSQIEVQVEHLAKALGFEPPFSVVGVQAYAALPWRTLHAILGELRDLRAERGVRPSKGG
jgi:hypothetical protein